MLNILICDDDKNIVQQVSSLLDKVKEKHNIDFKIDTNTDGEFSIDKNAIYDIAILDIEMNGISGLEVAEKLKRNNPDVIIIILTSYSDYLDSAMKISVFRYLSKPIDEQRFHKNFLEALEHYRNISKQIVVKFNDTVSYVKTRDILYIENLKHGSSMVTKTNTIKTNKKPEEWYAIIDQKDRFVFSHKSFLVNLQNIINFDKTTMTFQKQDERLDIACVSRRYYNDLKKAFFDFVGGK
ncbi:MAG: response regulator transcription factor [Ruminococcus sp.]|nr:response regulator transcription factor [Ruminococcus sp.]